MHLNLNKINKIIECYYADLSVRQIAKKIGISKTTVQKYITKYRNNELSQIVFFPEGNNKTTIPSPVSLKKRQLVFVPHEHHDSCYSGYPLSPIQYRREQEKNEEEQRRRLHQEELHQLKMKAIFDEGERKKKEFEQNFAYFDKIIQNNRKLYKEMNENNKTKMQKLEKYVYSKAQEGKQAFNSIPRLVIEEMKKSQADQEARNKIIQRDNNQNYPKFTVLKKADEQISKESDYSDVLGDVILGAIPVICNIRDFYQSPDSNIPMDSPEHWYRFCKYVKKDRKRET